jgi:hypothetical protein
MRLPLSFDKDIQATDIKPERVFCAPVVAPTGPQLVRCDDAEHVPCLRGRWHLM